MNRLSSYGHTTERRKNGTHVIHRYRRLVREMVMLRNILRLEHQQQPGIQLCRWRNQHQKRLIERFTYLLIAAMPAYARRAWGP